MTQRYQDWRRQHNHHVTVYAMAQIQAAYARATEAKRKSSAPLIDNADAKTAVAGWDMIDGDYPPYETVPCVGAKPREI